MHRMAGDLLDNRGRGDAEWGWPPIHPEGRKFGLAAVGVSLIVLVILHWQILGWPLLLGSLAVFAFFRDPERVVPQGADLIVSPADGLITLIQQVPPPAELQVPRRADALEPRQAVSGRRLLALRREAERPTA